MSASPQSKYSSVISNLPKYFFYIALLAVVLEFFPNQNGIIGILNREYKNTSNTISKNLEQGVSSDTNTSNNLENKNIRVGNESKVFTDFKITKIIDGDTIEVQKLSNASEDNKIEKYKVRLLGINTPESVDPRRAVECFGKESSKYVTDNFLGETVRLETDNSQSKYDKYDRLLAYVYISADIMINEKLINDGYAYEYTYDKPYKFQREFKAAQRLAKSEDRGLWSVDTCNGQK